MSPLAESPSLRFLALVGDQLDEARDVDKALKLALRLAREVFEADEACVARAVPGQSKLHPAIALPSGSAWDGAQLAPFLGERRPKMPPRLLVAPLRRRGRPWAVLALRRKRGSFSIEEVRDVGRVAEIVSRAVERMEAARIVEVRERIDRKVLRQLRPRDLFYQILHGLRSLTHYDHSAAILMEEKARGPLRLVAEQVAWRKGKSQRVGIERRLDEETLDLLGQGGVLGYDLVRGRWKEWRGRPIQGLAEALDYNHEGDEERREMSVICAPLETHGGAIGVIKVASCHPGSLGPYEGELVRRFLPQAATALRNVQRASTLESGMLAAERKHGLANMARGVSHDVNNALGSMLPLVQQLLADARAGRVDDALLVEDLSHIEESLRVCCRIFGGMLSVARGEGQALGEGNVRRAIDSTRAVLQDSLGRQGTRLEVELPDTLPSVRGAQADLEQLLLNLASNARDAMESGGALTIRVRHEDELVLVEVVDTGCGIPAEQLSRVKEPFFSTKSGGSGLGLAICRSILGSMGGRMELESQLGEGTRVRLRIPAAGRDAEEEA